MNKVFTFYAHARCDGCGAKQLEPMSIYSVITVEGGGEGLPLFLAFKQFCSDECQEGYVEELNSINGGLLAFGYEIVKEGNEYAKNAQV